MGDPCLVCGDSVPEDDDYALCSIKQCKLHFECAGIAENTWSRMGQKRRDEWKCKLCQGKAFSVPINNDTISKLHEDFLAKMQETIKEQFEIYSSKVNDQIAELKESVKFCCSKIDEYENNLSCYKKEVNSLKNNHEYLYDENQELKHNFAALKLQYETLEQYNRKHNIEIDGIPLQNDETMPDIVGTLSNIIGEPVNYQVDIQAAHRVPTKRKSGIKPIVVQFSNRQKRDAFLLKAKKIKIKSTAFVNNVPETFVYVNEHLTPFNRELLFKSKQLKLNGYKYVWPKDGKILAKKTDSDRDRAVHVASFEILQGLLRSSSQTVEHNNQSST